MAAARGNAVPLVVAPYLGAQARAWLQDQGINHLDLAGNARVSAPGIYIEREKRQRPERLTPGQRVNPFSKRASLVARALFNAGGEQRITELAERTGLAQGWVSLVIASLDRAGYIAREAHGIRLTNAAGLLRDWTNVYDWRRNPVVSFIVPYEYHELEIRLPPVLSQRSWALTLLSGANWVAPAVAHGQMHVYVMPGEERAVRDRLEGDLHAKAVSASSAGQATLHLLTPYYGRAAFFGAETIRGMHVVSPLQLYLDLVHFPVRGPEAADAILRTALAPQAGLAPADVASLLARA
jgi:hypothetical protein